MPARDVDTLVALNDRLLEPLLRADDAAAEREIEQLILLHARPLAAQILLRYRRSGGALPPPDADDAAATVDLRVLDKLRRVPYSAEEAIQNFENYVATLTYNVVNDLMRKRFPERARLKNRLRYTLLHDRRFALWTAGGRTVAGLPAWSDRRDAAAEVAVEITRAMRKSSDPGSALQDIFAAVGAPVDFDALVAFLADVWQIVDAPAADLGVRGAQRQPEAAARLESREYLGALWREIQQLRPGQRKALLLNLRDGETVNVASLLVLTGVAGFDDLAAALEVRPAELAAMWNELPFDDLRIAAMLGMTRQQVINLRKAARARLNRRVPS